MVTNFQLYKFDMSGEIQQTVNARELHEFLGCVPSIRNTQDRHESPQVLLYF